MDRADLKRADAGRSTGATLALALTDHDLFRHVGTLVMVSPNFAPKDGTAELLAPQNNASIAGRVIEFVKIGNL